MPLTLQKLIKAVKKQRARAAAECEHEVLHFKGGPGRMSVICPACGLMFRSGRMKLPDLSSPGTSPDVRDTQEGPGSEPLRCPESSG